VERAAVADYPPGAQMPPRVIHDCEFVWMLRGRARFTSDDVEFGLAPGQLLLVPPRRRHGFHWDSDRPSRHGYVHFGAEFLGRRPIPTVQLRSMTTDDPLAGMCAYLVWLGVSEQDGWQRRARQTLELMLDVFLSGPLPPVEPQHDFPPPLTAAVAHLRREWSQPPLRRLGVGELAAAALVSRGYLSRLFRLGFGVSPAPALEGLRNSRAETLLTRTDLRVDVIASQCGFADLSHFSHRFAASHGVSPREYRAAGATEPSVLDHPGIRRLAHLVWD
jgi:AraC family transcriptional regulator